MLFFAAAAQRHDDPEQARRHLRAGLALWDGTGFRDRVTEATNHYATYKLAVALLAGAALDKPLPTESAIVERLSRLQRDDGGWITDYQPDGTPRGQANVETTSLVILALEGLWRDG